MLLKSNPLDDITNTLDIEGVLRRGEWLDREALHALEGRP